MADDKKKQDSTFIDRLQSAGLLLLALGSKKLIYDEIRGKILPLVSENTYFQRYLKPLAKPKPVSRMRVGRMGFNDITEVYKNLASDGGIFSRHWNLMPGDKLIVQNLARSSELSSLETPEKNFVHRVVRRINPAFFENNFEDDQKIFDLFREMIDESLDSSRSVRAVVSEEYDNLLKEKEVVFSVNKRSRKTYSISELINKDSRFSLMQMSDQKTVPSDELDRKWRMFSDEGQQKFIKSGAPVLAIQEPLTVTDKPKTRKIEGLGRPSTNYLARRSDLQAFVQKLSLTRADKEVTSFFRQLDVLMRAELSQIQIAPNISYSLERYGGDALEGVVKVYFPGEGNRSPLKFSIPIAVNQVVYRKGNPWVLRKVRDIQPLLGGTMPDQSFYDIVLMNFKKRFHQVSWGEYLEGRGTNANNELNALIEDTFKEVRALGTKQPVQIEQLKAQVISVEKRIIMGKTSKGINDPWLVSDRIKSMQRLKVQLSRSRLDPKAPKEYFVIDFETLKSTGSRKVPHEVTILYVKDGQIQDLIRRDINPQSKEFKAPYTYPENDLRLSFGGMSPDDVKTRLEGATGGMNELSDVRKDIMSFIRSHVPTGTRVPWVAYGHDFERRVISEYFYEIQSTLTSWIDPLDTRRAITPGTISASLSQKNIGIDLGYFVQDKRSNSYRPTRAFIDLISKNEKLLHLLETKGGKAEKDFVRNVRLGYTEDKLQDMALHMATMDTIVTNEILVRTNRDLRPEVHRLQRELSRRIYQYTRGMRGNINPVAQANLAMLDVVFPHSISTSGLLQGNIPGLNFKNILPLSHMGIDPTRPFTQRVMGGKLVKPSHPSLMTEYYKRGIKDVYGDLYRFVTVASVDSPVTRGDASVVSVRTMKDFAMFGYPHTIKIPKAKNVQFHESIASLIEELQNAHPEQHTKIIKKRVKKIQQEMSKNSKVPGWIAPGTFLGEDKGLRYNTKGKLFSQLENIYYHKETDELFLTWNTSDSPTKMGPPAKLQLGTSKSYGGIVTGLRYDAAVFLNQSSRGRGDVILGTINRISENLKELYNSKEIRNLPEFKLLVEDFSSQVNRISGMKLKPEFGTFLSFIDTFSDKDLAQLRPEIIAANIEKFHRRDWVSFMTKFSSRIYQLRSKFGIQHISRDAVIPYWTPQTIADMAREQWRLRYPKESSFKDLPKKTQDGFLQLLVKEREDYVRESPMGKHLTESQIRRITRLEPGKVRVLDYHGNEFAWIATVAGSRAHEHAEDYAKGAMVTVPYMDTLVVDEKIGRRISRFRTPAQQDWHAFYEMSYPILAYGKTPDARFPIVKASNISIPQQEKNLKELRQMLGKDDVVHIPELGLYYKESDGPPAAALKNGEWNPMYTKEPLEVSRYMHPDTLRSLYGQNPRVMEYSFGKYKKYIPIPGLNQVSPVQALDEMTKRLSSGDIYQIVDKHVQTYANIQKAHQAYRRAEEAGDEKWKKREEIKLLRLTTDYGNQFLGDKSLFLKRVNPEIPGVMGPGVHTYLPGSVVDTPGNKHMIAGFGVQTVHRKDMGDKYFNMALESHRDAKGNFIGGTLKNYGDNKAAFAKAVLEGDELLVGTIIRTPAEGATAWLDTLYRVQKEGSGWVGLQARERILTKNDFDGDKIRLIINTASPEEKEILIKEIQHDARVRRRQNKKLRDRVNRMELNIQQFEQVEDFTTKERLRKDIKTDLESLIANVGTSDIDITETGVYIATPTEEARKMSGRTAIRKGGAYTMQFHPMKLTNFSESLKMDIADRFSTLMEEEYSGFLAQVMTKTGTPAGFRAGHAMRYALRASGDPGVEQTKNVLDKFYSKVTALKKFKGSEAEELLYAFQNPERNSSAQIIRKHMKDEFPDMNEYGKFAEVARQLRMKIGLRNVNNLLRGAIRGVQLTHDMIAAYAEDARLPAHLKTQDIVPRESIIGKMKSANARLNGLGGVVALAGATLLFTAKEPVSNEQNYVMPNFHQVSFPSRMHIKPVNPARKAVNNWEEEDQVPGIKTSVYSLTTSRIGR